MSASNANFGKATSKGRRIKKSADRKDAYQKSFGDFPEETVYRDPLGINTGGKPVTFQKDWSEKLHNEQVEWDHTMPGPNRASIVEKWNALQRKGYDLKQTSDMIGKSLGTGNFQLPLDIIQDVFIVNPEQTPAADFIPRVTTQDDVVHATPQTEEPDPSFDLEGNVSTDSDGNAVYDFEDPQFADLEYNVLGYGVATRTTDKLILAGSNLRSHESVQEQALMTGHRQRTERQIFWGTDNAGPASGDPNGWTGMSQMGQSTLSAISESDFGTPETLKENVEQAIDLVEENGGDLSNIAVFGGYDFHRTLRRSFEDEIRYTAADELDTGFATFAMEGGNVPVFKTNAIPRISDYPDAETNDAAFVVNLDSVALYQLQDVTMQPLAKLGPQERIAVDQYSVLVSETGDGSTRTADHIERLQVQTS
jgi:hypothetical protein